MAIVAREYDKRSENLVGDLRTWKARRIRNDVLPVGTLNCSGQENRQDFTTYRLEGVSTQIRGDSERRLELNLSALH